MTETLIVSIKSKIADLEEMKKAVTSQTGDEDPFFCPVVIEGYPYDGHAHTFPPRAISEAIITPIEI